MANLELPRTDYNRGPLDESQVDPNPVVQVRKWLDDAIAARCPEPNAMTLATIGPDGPNARIVLLKGIDDRGLVFFTNYGSQKALELAFDPRAALCLVWLSLSRQIRVTGTCERTSIEESDEYFRTRPRASQLGAWASAQSRVIDGRSVLEERLAELAAQHDGKDVPLPPFWGGFRLVPSSYELWQGRENRLHDRLRYVKEGIGWRVERLSP